MQPLSRHQKYLVLSDPTGIYIGHLDYLGKFLAQNKVLITQSQDKRTNETFDGISDFFKKERFEIFRVMCQDIYVPIAEPRQPQPLTPTASSLTNMCMCL